MPDSQKTSKSHLRKALGWSLAGLVAAWQEIAFRQEIYSFCVLVPLAFVLGQSGVERAMLIGSLLLILIVEVLNTAVEAAIDRISLEHHSLSGKAKDLASAAVFIAMINAAVVWLLIVLD
jgi:diacylglycerol kinase (ATP)